MTQLPSHILWGQINFFSLFAHLGVLPEIFLTTKVKQTSQPPSYPLFDISGNWYMRGSIEQLCLSPQQPARAPAGVDRERGAPVQLELQGPGFLGSGAAKWRSCWGNDPPLKGLSLGILGYTVRKFHSCFWQRVSGASPASPLCRVDRHPKTSKASTVHCYSILLKCSVSMNDRTLIRAAKSGGPLMQLYTTSHQFEASFTFHQLTIVTQSAAFIWA